MMVNTASVFLWWCYVKQTSGFAQSLGQRVGPVTTVNFPNRLSQNSKSCSFVVSDFDKNYYFKKEKCHLFRLGVQYFALVTVKLCERQGCFV